MRDLEAENALEHTLVAKERFKGFLFRYRVMNKVQKLREFNRESYEFMRASLEVQALLKDEAEALVVQRCAKYQRQAVAAKREL